MSELKIDCPHCHKAIELTEALAGPMLEAERMKARAEGAKVSSAEREAIAATAKKAVAAEYAGELEARDKVLAEQAVKVKLAEKAELAARQAKKEAEEALESTELEVARRVDAERESIAAAAAKKAATETGAQLAAALAQVADKDAKLLAAERAELAALKAKREADEALERTELEVTRRLEAERTKVREQALLERDSEYRLKIADKDAKLRAVQDQLEEMQRKSAATSQQLVGDVQEIDLLNTLQEAYPADRFERIKKGQRGADVLQTVVSGSGAACGTILWESKRTRNWSEPWIGKLREDQREAKADIAALATETMPEGQPSFGERDGIWITPVSTVVPVAAALRQLLISVAIERRAGALADTAKDHVFSYLTSPQFRQRVSRIVESYAEMRGDLDREKRAISAGWGKREKQLDRIVGGMTGFYGDLQGIVGASLPPVEGLMLEAPLAAEKPKFTVVNSDAAQASRSIEDPLLS